MALGFYDFLDGLHRGRRRASRGDAAGVQGDRRGAVRGGARQGRLRHRDALARDQHAGEDRRHRGPLEVPGRTTRAPDPGGVHAAHGPRRASRDRPARTRGRRLPASGAVRARGGARGHPDVRPDLVVPTFVQHGGQPGPQLHARAGPRALERVVRTVPGRPRRRRARTSARAGSRRRSRATGRTSVSPRRLRGVLGSGPEGATPARGGPAWSRGGAVGRGPAAVAVPEAG